VRGSQDTDQKFAPVLGGHAPSRLEKLRHRRFAEHDLPKRSLEIQHGVTLGEANGVHEVADCIEQVRKRWDLAVVPRNPMYVA
jgi:hypothetical protein